MYQTNKNAAGSLSIPAHLAVANDWLTVLPWFEAELTPHLVELVSMPRGDLLLLWGTLSTNVRHNDYCWESGGDGGGVGNAMSMPILDLPSDNSIDTFDT
jgi:hypothetical protein